MRREQLRFFAATKKIRSLLSCSNIASILAHYFHLFQEVSLVIYVFPGWMGLSDVVVKLPVHKHLVAWRTAEILWLHVLLLEMAFQVIKAARNPSTNETHVSVGHLLHLCLHH